MQKFGKIWSSVIKEILFLKSFKTFAHKISTHTWMLLENYAYIISTRYEAQWNRISHWSKENCILSKDLDSFRSLLIGGPYRSWRLLKNCLHYINKIWKSVRTSAKLCLHYIHKIWSSVEDTLSLIKENMFLDQRFRLFQTLVHKISMEKLTT